MQVAQIPHDGHQDIGEGIGLGSVVAQLFIFLVELLDGLFLMAEDLDHFLAVDHLFNVSVQIAKGLLLSYKKVAAFACDLSGYI